MPSLVGEFEAEDLTQEIFVRIHRALPNFRGEAQLQTWIYRIATNAAVDRLRSPSYKRTASGTTPDDLDLEEIEVEDQDLWRGNTSPSPEQQVFQQQRLDCYCDYLEKIPPIYRLVVILNQLDELTAPEIADILGLSLEVVKTRLQRGKARLLEEFKAHCKAEDWL